MSMLSWKESLLEIDQNTKKTVQLLENIQPEQMNWKPTAHAWSINEVLQHLIKVHESYYPVFDQMTTNNLKLPFYAKWHGIVNLLGNMILQSMKPTSTIKTKTFSIWEPTKYQNNSSVLNMYIQHKKEWLQHLDQLNKWFENKTVIYSPANFKIVYYFKTAIYIILYHEKRHLGQMERIKNQMR